MKHSETLSERPNRASFFFIIGLVLAAAFAMSMDGPGRLILARGVGPIDVGSMDGPVPVGPRALTDADHEAAIVAWRYIDQNTRPETGFVDSVAGFPSTTLWDQGSYLLALCSAQALGVIGTGEFDSRVERFLDSVERLPLFEGVLPNKAYHTQTLAMVTYDNTPTADGVGWSALDIARMLSGFRVLERRAPRFGDRIRGVLAGWDLQALAYQGELTGAAREAGVTSFPQEGRIGYEQYGARAAALWGLDVIPAMSAARIVEWERIAGVTVPTDRRDHTAFRSITPVLSEPYMLQGLELGLDSESQLLASRVYLAQEARYWQSGRATMVSEDHVNAPPYFVYSSVFSNGEPWAVVSEDGEFHNDLRTVSLKAAFAWDALYGREYTAELRRSLAGLAGPGGWFAGRYEKTGEVNDALTLNTNAVVLEAMHYKAFGPLWQVR